MGAGAGSPDLVRSLAREVIAAFFAYPHLVAAALSVLAAAAIVAGFWMMRGAYGGARSAQVALRAQALRGQRDHRAMVLIGAIRGGGGKALREALSQAISNEFGAFAFQAPVQVEPFPFAAPVTTEKQTVERRRRIHQAAADTLERTQADIIIWGSRNFLTGEVELRIAAPPPPNHLPDSRSVAFKWRAGAELGRIGEAIAYLCARRSRPVLNRPQDYKPEKLQPIVLALDTIVNEGSEDLSDPARLELLGDFASGALSLGERGGETGWLLKALDARRQYLDRVDRAADPGAWGRAQQEVGRALAALGEREADRAKLEEAVGILKLSLDALRATESLQSAEVAMRALSRAEQTLAQRKRIGLRWPV